MDSNQDDESKQRIGMIMIIVYPFLLLVIAILLNIFVFDVNSAVVALPLHDYLYATAIAAALLIFNHTWLMTTTELTRARYHLYSTPEEWDQSGRKPEKASREAQSELKRHHDTHLNNTENIIYFVFLVVPFILISPSPTAAYVLLIGYAVSRLAYTYSFLSGKDGMRGLFMTLSLLAMYTIGCYLIFSLFK